MAKKKILPEELQQIVDDIKKKEQEEDVLDAREFVKQVREQREQSGTYWDVRKEDKIDYFDPELSYEITGYRPITQTKGLDFDPKWFTETREEYLKTGKYCPYLPKSKRYNLFWEEQYKRCKYGMTSHGYTITGDNYFFLNFYQLPIIDLNKASGEGTNRNFPEFMASQYMFFHYLQMAKILHKHAALMKARSIGFSEINASISARMFSIIRNSRIMITCFNDVFLKGTFSKFENALNFLNTKTEGGMFKPLVTDRDLLKEAGVLKKNEQGQYVASGWQAQAIGINASNPRNIRGDRVDMLIYDECGSFPNLATAVVQGQELCEVQGVPRGFMLFGGTGGDQGAPLEGLKKIYYHPRTYKVLPFRHNWTQDGSYIESGFFLPYFAQSLNKKYMDNRGVCDVERYKEEVLIPERNLYLDVPEDYLRKCAERCWTAEEAFNLEGVNKFNKSIIANQLAEIRLHKRGPKIQTGIIDYTYKNSKHTEENIDGFKWIPQLNGKVQILEHPVWSDLYKQDLAEKKKKAEEAGEEFVIPEYNEMDNLYVAGIDGIDIGQNQTSTETRDPSDFCIVIKKRAFGLNDPQYVCMYKDRPGDVREAYKIAMCLCRYYNAKINIEATRMAMVNWARDKKGYLKYFMKRPRATLTDIKYGTTKQIGTPATKVIIEQQTDLIADFIQDYGYTIWFEEMLEELNAYNDENKTKFDIVASLGMSELADLELSGRLPSKVDKEVEVFEDFGWFINDRGYKEFGIIPKKELIPFDTDYFNLRYDDPYRIETSDPRLLLRTI